MADIFDKKQEVLDVVLTRKGREMMAKNNFVPDHYEFYDSDIVYDANNNETQNNSSVRIKDGLYQKGTVSVEKIIAEGSLLENDANGLLKNPIGSYQIGTQNAPAWNINFEETGYLTGSFSTSERHVIVTDLRNNIISSSSINGINTNEERIPQFYVNVKYKLYQFEQELKDGGIKTSLYYDKSNEDVLLSLEEENAFTTSEMPEFDVEFFLIEDEGDNSSNNKIIKKMFFDKENFDDLDSVENYFNVLFDEEARFQNNFKKKDIYNLVGADDGEECE
tara:strand:- start:1645 stop:2478 length:834 start_codon:yes stop_codon:yes gene_type:complete